MARLPSAVDIMGSAANLRSGRVIASYDVSGLTRGIQQFGAGLEELGTDIRKQQITVDGTAADGGASKDLNDFERTFDSNTDYGTFGKSFEEGAAKIRDKYAAQIRDPQARQTWIGQFDKRALSSRSRVLDLAQRGERDGRLASAQTGLEGYQSVIADPSASEDARAAAKKNADASISALQESGDLSAQTANTWRDKIVSGGEFIYGQRQIEADPSILTKSTGPTANMIRETSAKYGVNPDIPIAIANIESGGNQNASNPKSSATGVFQITSGTASDYGIDPTDKAQNIDAGVRLTRDNANALKSATGKDPTPGDIYLAHFLGVGAAGKVLGADPDAPVSNYVSDGAINANRTILEGKTVGQVRAWADGKMAKAMGGKLPDWYTSQSPERQLQLEKQAQARSNQLQTEVRGNLQDVIQNAPVAIQNTGTYSGEMPTQDDFTAAFGAQDGSRKYDAFQTAMQTGHDVYDMRTMSGSQIAQMVSDARPTSSGDDAGLQSKRYQAISSAADATMKARESDPVTYVQQNFPNVRQAWENVAQGGDVSSAITATAVAEQSIGIRNMQVLPSAVAKQTIEQFKQPDISDDDRLGSVTSLVFSTNDPGQRRAVFNQLVDAGLPPMTEGAVEAFARGDEGAARRLMQAAIIKPEDLPKNSTVTPATISDTIYSSVWSDGEIGDVAYGLSYGDASSMERAQRGTDLLNRAVRLRMAQGEDLQTAVDSAKKDLFGDVSIYDGGSGVNAELAVPSDTDTNALTRGLDQAKSDFALALTDQRDRLAGQMKASAAPTGHFSGLVEQGNIDLAKRPVVQNDDGTISTVRSMSFEEDGKEVLVPTVSPDGKILSDQDAIDLYHKTGQFLGKFDSADNADAYAQALHESQARFYANRSSNGGKAILDAATTNRMNDVIQNGIFVSVGNGIGLRDPYTGQFVTDVDGKTPLTIPLDEILKRGKATPATRGEGEFDRTKSKAAYGAGMSQIEGWTGQ